MKRIFHLVGGCLLLAVAFFLAGCRTPDTDTAHSGQMASLEISGHSEVEILRTLKDVFESNGYEHMEDLTFDKKGSAWDTVLYGGWDTDGVWIRLKASVDPGPNGDYVIGCDAYRVIGRNQAVLEQEQKTPHANRDECKRLLDEVQARLASGAPGSGQ